MTREKLSQALQTARPGPDDVVYLERRGADYGWGRTRSGEPLPLPTTEDAVPNVWLFYGGHWPVPGSEAWSRHFEDLMAELESASQQSDRCRWPLDDPWPHSH